MEKRELKYIPLDDLQLWKGQRDIRAEALSDLTDSIEADGFNPSNPLRTFQNNGYFDVVAGGHRLEALRALGYEGEFEVPCIVEPDESDPYQVAAEDNRHDEASTPEDLFDFLDRIERLRPNHTQKEIGEKLGWSTSKVKKHSALLSNVVPKVLEIAKAHQEGRVTEEVPSGTFTEGWFRDSGLYELSREGTTSYQREDEGSPVHVQVRLMRWYCEKKNCNASKTQVQKRSQKLLEKCNQLDVLAEEINPGVDDEQALKIKRSVIRGEHTESSLKSAIQNANQEAQNRALFGVDGIAKMQEMEENSVGCVVTDPPYGVGYKSHRETENFDFGGDRGKYVQLLDAAFDQFRRVCKANAHIYLFFPMRHYTPTVRAAKEHFEVTETPLIWLKNNHAPTRDASEGFEKMYAQKYESILLCRMPGGADRPLNVDGVEDNVFNFSRPSGEDRWHDSQKPIPLLQHLIEMSTGEGETVLDPFAGSGSTLLAAQRAGRHYIGFEKEASPESRFKREMRKL